MSATDGMGTKVVRPVDRDDFNSLRQFVEYMDKRLIEVESELLNRSPNAREHSSTSLKTAAVWLVAKLDEIHADPRYKGVWESAQIHGMAYNGPNYTVELKALRAALQDTPAIAALPQPSAQGVENPAVDVGAIKLQAALQTADSIESLLNGYGIGFGSMGTTEGEMRGLMAEAMHRIRALRSSGGA